MTLVMMKNKGKRLNIAVITKSKVMGSKAVMKDKQGSPQASNDKGQQIQNMDHEGHLPKHVLASSPRQGAMTSSPKLEYQTTKKKTKKSSRKLKGSARHGK